MNGEFPWIYVAMVVIAFISWVFNRIQEATAERQRAAELKRRRQEQAEKPESSRQPPPLRRESLPQETAPPPIPEEAQEARPGEMLRELMEALGAPAEVRAPEPVVHEVPRQPVSQPKVNTPAAPVLSAQEREALKRIQSADESAATVAHRSPGVEVAELRSLLSSTGGLRKAVILKEILDTPVGLRDPSAHGR